MAHGHPVQTHCRLRKSWRLSRPRKIDPVAVKDTQETGLDAYTMLVPTGWQARGAVTWDTSRTAAPCELIVRVTNPNGGEEFNRYPSQLYCWSQAYERYMGLGRKVQGCLIERPVDGPVTALRQIVLPMLRDQVGNQYRIVAADDLPKLAAAYATMYQQPGQPGGTIRAGPLVVEYSQAGQVVRNELRGVFIHAQGPSGVTWGLDHTTTFKAEAFRFDQTAIQMDMMAWSLHAALPFTDELDKVTQILIDNFYTDQAAIMERARIMEQAQQQISDQIIQGWQHRSGQMDAIAEAYDSKAVRGVQDRTNPFTHEVEEAPDQYDYVWVNSLGQRIYSNSAGYNPNGESNLDRRQMPAANCAQTKPAGGPGSAGLPAGCRIRVIRLNSRRGNLMP
jgi:hypothetical protein